MAAKSAAAQTPSKQPNILVIVGDDVGMWNLSAYHRGMMAGPNQASGTFSIDTYATSGSLWWWPLAEASQVVRNEEP